MIAKLLYQCTNITGEAATWLAHQKKLLWVDIEGKLLYEYSIQSKDIVKHNFDDMVTTIIPCARDTNSVILALENKLVSYELNTRKMTELIDIPTNNGTLRTNDGKSSPSGGIWLGVMHYTNHNQTGSLYRIDKDMRLEQILHKQCIPNGIVWSLDAKRMYYADSGRACVTEYVYDIEKDEISLPRIAITIPPEYGVPDGMTIDRDGMLWIAHWGGYGVYVWNPNTGELIDKIDLPVPNVASCTFGGDNMDELYITTARAGLSDEELKTYPLSGSLFVANTKSNGGLNHYTFNP